MKTSLLLATLVLAVAAACGAQTTGSSATATPTATAAAATPTPASGATLTLSPGTIPPNLPFPFTPGLPIPPVVRDVVLNVSSQKADALAAMVKMQQVGCTTAQGAGGPPKCKPGEAAGTMYTLMPTGGCEGTWSADPRATMGSLLNPSMVLYAAVEVKAPNPDPEPYFPKGQYVVLFTASGANPPGIYFVLDGSNIVRAHSMCTGGSGAEITLLRQLGATSFLIPPK